MRLVGLTGVRQDSDSEQTVYEYVDLDSTGAPVPPDRIPMGAKYIELTEMAAAPAAPAADGCRLFLKDSGAGKTQLCALFATGSAIVVSVQA